MSDAEIAARADRFVEAIAWGEHRTVWELLSPVGREHVLQAGARRGLDPLQAARIRQGTSPHEEFDAFLTGLVQGLRVDFSAVPIDEVRGAVSTVPVDDGSVDVLLTCPASFGDGRWAAGSLLMSCIDGEWFVDRARPLVSRSE